MQWSPDGSTLASGGNENFLCLWDASMSGSVARGASMGARSGDDPTSRAHKPRRTLTEHKAAVKALAWCPFQRHLLGSGGGTADRTIKVMVILDGASTCWTCRMTSKGGEAVGLSNDDVRRRCHQPTRCWSTVVAAPSRRGPLDCQDSSPHNMRYASMCTSKDQSISSDLGYKCA